MKDQRPELHGRSCTLIRGLLGSRGPAGTERRTEAHLPCSCASGAAAGRLARDAGETPSGLRKS